MRLKVFVVLASSLFLCSVVSAQVPVAPEYGTLTAGPGEIVFTNNATSGDFVLLNSVTNSGRFATIEALENAGAIGHISASKWLIGMTSDAPSGAGDVFIFDEATSEIGNPITNVNDVRDMAVIDQGNQFDAIVADRENDVVHFITDLLGSPSTQEITPSSIVGNVGIQGVVALSDSLYFLYDESPEGGFGDDELIVVEGNDSNAQTTRISWNAIGSAGAGLSTDELSVDFHNGLAVRQPDESTIVLYLSNFGAFSENQIIEVVWNDAGNGFDFSTPTTSILFTESDLYDAIAENNGDAADPISILNSRGVTLLPEDQLVIWVDDSDNGNTYMVLYDLTSESFSLFGGDALEILLEGAAVTDWSIQQ
jgi:hypothetical protein